MNSYFFASIFISDSPKNSLCLNLSRLILKSPKFFPHTYPLCLPLAPSHIFYSPPTNLPWRFIFLLLLWACSSICYFTINGYKFGTIRNLFLICQYLSGSFSPSRSFSIYLYYLACLDLSLSLFFAVLVRAHRKTVVSSSRHGTFLLSLSIIHESTVSRAQGF